ncbi:MAG: hypothetical protein AUJ92_07880 [Armatimonadetes bacterium CG2_30_59_28]|nr:MAG: hypothetical protein AUJ92_07880 [Armatimonadetes bacterium CG2_30_59_28]PIU63610.1 MAG: hypothetical protein COS85_15475 [Armatimonadetes bacterium CG07_land_8_20_14_0_80_59_28]PIX41044.1 MAG: hypothetical protein COZ56_13100 [Armatimonadetes bacterium CG_4_8_14_3_um_filter_58_9]PIY41282.1 MAG: hypothetical protein COZ05_15885 [Armatimonadetes bacterium CG_4_10_14_3_um_filter_59_10]
MWELCGDDCGQIARDFCGREVAKQLIRSVGSIPANIEKGDGREYGKELAHFPRVARGSARESQGWYIRANRLLSPDTGRYSLRAARRDHRDACVNHQPTGEASEMSKP